MNLIIEFKNQLLSVLYPEWCIICGTGLVLEKEKKVPLCNTCQGSFTLRNGTLCKKCGKPLLTEKTLCLQCRVKDLSFTHHYSLMSYNGNAKKLIQAYKFQGRRLLAKFIAELSANPILYRYGNISIVPVPPRPKGKRKRGWDPVDLITKELHTGYALEIIRILKRKGGKQQKSLDYNQRLTNLRGNVKIKSIKNLPEQVLLLDDVYTTGATLNECSRVLKDRGVKQIFCLTIAAD
jgi:competence protein ComFC